MQQLLTERIKALFYEGEMRAFDPRQLAEQGLGAEGELIAAFRELADTGAVKGRALVRCAEGHDVWYGRPEELSPGIAFACPKHDCDTHRLSQDDLGDEENQPYVLAQFELTDLFVAELDASKKKTRVR